jgi:hypothetical protein
MTAAIVMDARQVPDRSSTFVPIRSALSTAQQHTLPHKVSARNPAIDRLLKEDEKGEKNRQQLPNVCYDVGQTPVSLSCRTPSASDYKQPVLHSGDV